MEKLNDLKNMPLAPYPPLVQTARRVAAEGCVLLKNENRVLPIKKDSVISLFGRTQINYVKSGTGSGGLVRVDYVVNILEGIRNNPKLTLNEELVSIYEKWLLDNPFDIGNGWATERWSQIEMVPDDECVKSARAVSDTAVIVIGRTAGEDRDNSTDKGCWYLSDEEEALLSVVSRYFEKTVVLLNTGNIIDMKWVEKYNIKSVMYVWQGGQEGGNAVADVLSGNITPCGKLTDTIASDISLYPSMKNFGNEDFNIYAEDIYVGYRYFETFAKNDVLYPFGFGLSYTEFEYSDIQVLQTASLITLKLNVKNTGEYSGREIVQLYFSAPQGLLGKSARELCAFSKTKLLSPGESQSVTMDIKIDNMSAYDDSGITGNKSCYVLEAGEYSLYLGACVSCAKNVYSFNIDKTTVTCKCQEALAPEKEFEVMYPVAGENGLVPSYRKVSCRTVDYDKRIKQNLPKDIPLTGDKGIKLADVKAGKYTMEQFVAQLSETDLMCMARGEGMCSPKVRPGSAGAVGGLTDSLLSFGIPAISMHDGPSGIRMDSNEHATSLPNGTCIACTWDEEIAEKIYEDLSAELYIHSIDSILGPGVNIHRVPLNGRNFEYFSEDPFVSGKIAAALIRGVESYGNSATIKHFAANSQEYKRRDVDSVMSERAAREIYLKTFEIPVKEAHPTSLMTSYNPLNGKWTANNYELNTIILRDEWGYDGFAVTDWWPKLKADSENDDYINLKNMVEAQNDVYMPTVDALNFKDNLSTALKNGDITIGQLQRNAMNILKYIMNSHAMERFCDEPGYSYGINSVNPDELPLAGELTGIVPNEPMLIKVDKFGTYLLAVEYSSNQEETTQMTISLFLDDKSAASITVNGTKGKVKTVYREISIAHNIRNAGEKIKLSAQYPNELLSLSKIKLLLVHGITEIV